MNRHYVHLSMNEDTALQIGKCNTTLKKGRGDNHYLCNWSILSSFRFSMAEIKTSSIYHMRKVS